MADYYVDDGNNPGGSGDAGTAANPWLNTSGLQTMLDTLVAGEEGIARGTFMADGTGNDDRGLGAVPLDIDQNQGGNAGSVIKLIGMEAKANWTEDSSRCEIDAGDAAASCFLVDDKDGWYVKNIEGHSATGDVWDCTDVGYPDFWTFVNCTAHDSDRGWGRSPAGTRHFRYASWIRCVAYDNTTTGFRIGAYDNLSLCAAFNCGDYGFQSTESAAFWGCLAVNNVTGFYGSYLQITNSVAAKNTDGIRMPSGPCLIAGCRLYNDTHDIWADTAQVTALHNACRHAHFGTFVDDEINGISTTKVCATTDFEDYANDLYNLILGVPGYRNEVEIYGSNYARFAMGLPTMKIPVLGGRK